MAKSITRRKLTSGTMPHWQRWGFFMRFTIRDVIWLTVVIAMGLGWWVERRNNAPLRAEVATVRDQLDTLVLLIRARGFQVVVDP